MKAIPSISTLYTNISTDLKNKLRIYYIGLKLVVDAISSVGAAQFKLAYQYLADVQNEIYPDTATPASEGGQLNRLGQIYLKRQPFPATSGVYTASVIGVEGAVLPASLTFKSNDTSESPGNLYVLDAEYICTGEDDIITLRSLNAGTAYELNVGDGLTVTQPVIGMQDVVTIAALTTLPTEGEDTPLYRQNVLNAIVLQPQGGSKADYRLWSSDAAGVERVYPYVKNTDAGTIQLFVEATVADSTDQNGTPSDDLLAAVTTVIEFNPDATLPDNQRGRMPMGKTPEVDAITPIPVDVQIIGLQTTTSAIQTAIISDLAAFLFGVRPYIAGCDLPAEKNDTLTTVKVQSVVTDTIGNSNTFLGFVLSVDGNAVNTYTFSAGNIPYLRNVTYS
jgi:uncharacterized phage protein gp47/JayE